MARLFEPCPTEADAIDHQCLVAGFGQVKRGRRTHRARADDDHIVVRDLNRSLMTFLPIHPGKDFQRHFDEQRAAGCIGHIRQNNALITKKAENQRMAGL